ncbi:Fc receptor-like protein 5 [Acanthopagrus schlegelii]
MEAAALCVRLLMLEFILLATTGQKSYAVYGDALCLRIHPNRQQYFEYHSVSFHCDGPDSLSLLRRVNSSEQINPACQNKRTSTGFICTISNIYVADSGEYWCETKGGQRSNSVNITVTDGSVILDIPALPVLEGGAVTLSCKKKTTTHHLSADFYKDGVQIESSSTGDLIINNVNKSHEGFYKCSTHDAGESPGSWLAVRDAPPSDGNTRTLSPAEITVTILFLALLLLAVGFLYIRNRRDLPSYQSVVFCFSSKIQAATSHSGQDNQMVSGDEPADNESSLTYEVVFPQQRKTKDSADAADDDHHVETNQSRKPQTDKDEDEVVYSTLKISDMSHDHQHAGTGDT